MPPAPSAEVLPLVRVVTAVVGKVAQPLLRNASSVLTPKIALLLAGTAVLIQFVRPVPAIVLAIAEEPVGDAPVVCVSRAPPPALRAVGVPALVRRLIAVVSAVVVEVAPPELRDAFAIVARKLLGAVAGPVVADALLLVAAVGAVVVPVALPGAEDAAARLAALEHVKGHATPFGPDGATPFSALTNLEHVLRAVVLAVGLVAVVAAVVDAIADGGGQGALLVLALELALAARPGRARGRLVGPVLAVYLAVAPASFYKFTSTPSMF